MTQQEAMQTARLFHFACRVPVALYTGRTCFFTLPDNRQTASTLLGNGDPLPYLDVDAQQLYSPQHVRSGWRESFIFLAADGDLNILCGPMTLGTMDETRVRRLFNMMRPLGAREGSLRKHLSSLQTVSGTTCHYLGRLMTRLFPCTGAEKAEEKPGEKPGGAELSPVIKSAIAFIDDNVGEHLTAQSIADHAQVHRDYLSTLFKKETGVAMMVFIQQRRAAYACRLIRQGSMSFQEISQRCRFSSQSRFADIFKRHIGMTPTQYKQEAALGLGAENIGPEK